MTTPGPNQKGDLPRIPGGARFTLSRGKFLDGTIQTYYGPGQPPDAGSTYAAPADWPPAGSLLRVPQVVWLTLAVGQFDLVADPDLPQHSSYSLQYAAAYVPPVFRWWVVGTTPVGPEGGFAYTVQSDTNPTLLDEVSARGHLDTNGDFLFEHPPNPDGAVVTTATAGTLPVPSFTTTIASPYPAEYARIKAAYAAAKARVESLRPGRTFVQVNDPFLWSTVVPPTPPNTDNRRFFTATDLAIYWHMIAPDVPPDQPWFGTDFLHVYAGTPSETEALGGPARFVPFNPASPDDDEVFAAGRTLLDDHAGDFRSYAVRCYGMLAAFDAMGHAPLPTLAPPASPTTSVSASHFDGGGVMVAGDIDVPWAQATTLTAANATMQGQVDALNAQIDSTNASNAHRDDPARQFLRDTCAYLSGLGLDYAYADDTPALDADALVQLIADHYKFDPDTGEDLP